MADLKYLVIFLVCLPYIHSIRIYYMDSLCGEEIDMVEDNIHAGRLDLTSSYEYQSNMNCRVVIKASFGERIMFAISDLDTELSNDELSISPTNNADYSNTEKFSGHDDPYTNTDVNSNSATLVFKSDKDLEYSGFSIIFTEFHKGVCSGYKCYGGECIDSSLECDGTRNCDNSVDDDELCLLTTGEIVGIVVGSLVGVAILGVITVAVLRFVVSSGRKNTPPVIYQVTQQPQAITTIQSSAPPPYSSVQHYSQPALQLNAPASTNKV